jgi:uncharacterized protein YycO
VAYDVRNLEPGDVILVVGRGAFAWLIQVSTANPFSHAAIAVGDGRLVEAQARVVERPAGEYAADGWAYRVQAGVEARRAAATLARSRLGEPYGIAELLYDAARFDLHWFARVRPLSHVTCSGLVAAAYAGAGVVLTYAPWPAPADLSYSPLLWGPRPWSGTAGNGRHAIRPGPKRRRARCA